MRTWSVLRVKSTFVQSYWFDINCDFDIYRDKCFKWIFALKQNENLLIILEQAFSQNNVVQESLQTLISTWVERLKTTWNERITLTLDEFEVRELCMKFAQESQQNCALIQASGGQQPFLPNPREYVVKSKHSWKGFKCMYYERPTLYGDSIRPEEFRSRIICDSTSGAVNLIQTTRLIMWYWMAPNGKSYSLKLALGGQENCVFTDLVLKIKLFLYTKLITNFV